MYLFPEGNNAPFVSVYLAAFSPEDIEQESKPTPQPSKNDWAICAQFCIDMWNPEDPSVIKSEKSHHRFSPETKDWGFTQFYKLKDLTFPIGQHSLPMISNNKVNFTVYLRILNDPTGVLWHNMSNYNSKKATGFTGLKNQGATCYLNSLLQSLYFTTAFRHAVFQIPTDDDSSTIPYALQRIFAGLHSSEDPVGTSELTRSFGWDSGDEFTQHDVQELNRVLMDNLEGKMKGTSVQGALNNIFVGQFKSYIKCVNVDFESSRIEDYWDIQLNVKGLRNLKESFEDYVQVEMLDGENQYMATGHGLQDAKKGVVFKSFPPVLHLQLKRYDYDPITGNTVKINDRYEFPTNINLSPYIEEDSRDPNEDYEYELHGVLVHSGDLDIGHYYALIKPTKEGPWYKFDDDKVTRVTMKEVLEDNFGGVYQNKPNLLKTRVNTFSPHTSAYMLVYIRKSKLDQILFKDTIPKHILQREELKILEKKNLQRKREEQYLFINVHVASAARQFRHNTTFDMAVFYGRTGIAQEDQSEKAVADTFRVKRTTTPKQLLDLLQKELYPDVDREALQLWSFKLRPNKTYRPNEIIPDSQTESLEHLGLFNKNDSDCFVFLEIADPELYSQYGSYEKIFAEVDPKRADRVLLFLKYFDPLKQTLVGVRTVVCYGNDTAGSLIPIICKTMNWPANTPVQLWEEIKPFMTEQVDPEKTITDCELFNGDIITFERKFPPEVLDEGVPAFGFKTPDKYYDFLCNRIRVTFRHRYDPEVEMKRNTDNAPLPTQDYTVWIDKQAIFKEASEMLASHTGVDPKYLQLFVAESNGRSHTPVNLLERLDEKMNTQNRQMKNEILYSILRMSLSEFESQKLVEFVWISKDVNNRIQHHEVLVPKTSALSVIISHLPSRVGITEEELPEVTAWIAMNHRISKILDPKHPVISLQSHQTLCFSLESPEEHKLLVDQGQDTYRLIEVFHFFRDVNHPHGIPFKFILIRGEKFAQTKTRLQKTLGMYDKLFEQVKFAIVSGSDYDDYEENSNLPNYVDGTYSNNGNEGVTNSTGGGNGRSRVRYLVDEVATNGDHGLTSPTLDGTSESGDTNGSKKVNSFDNIELYEEMHSRDALGLDHLDRTIRKNVAGERSVLIKN